jgi:hypothetical protein
MLYLLVWRGSELHFDLLKVVCIEPDWGQCPSQAWIGLNTALWAF